MPNIDGPRPRRFSAWPEPNRRRFLPAAVLLSFSLFTVSCATSPFTADDGERRRPSRHPSPDLVVPEWRPFVTAEGLGYFAGRVARPGFEFHAVRLDLRDDSLRIAVSGGIGDSLSMKVSGFVRDGGLLVGVNALPFEPVSGREGEPRVNVGVVVADGRTISPPRPGLDALVFLADGSVVVMGQAEMQGMDGIVNAVGGFRRILEDGSPVPEVLGLKARHPRTAAGISACGSFLYLLVVDGRRLGSVGSTEEETALLLASLGARDGINFDGGGSSALAVRLPDGRVRVLNTPIHGRIPGRERAVAGSIGVGRRMGE